MEHIKIRCNHCKKEYTYCTYGNGPEYGTEEGCSEEYCAECQKAIDNALANIPVKFKPIKVEITDEEEKKILIQLYDIKAKIEKGDVFHMITLLNSDYDNIDIYICNSKTYYVEYNDNTPNDKHLSIEMEYDIIAGKTTSKLWKTTNKNTFQHGRSIINEFKKKHLKKNMKAWIARDKDGETFLHSSKPEREYEYWYSSSYCIPITKLPVTELPEGVNPQWEDEEPIEVELKIEKI